MKIFFVVLLMAGIGWEFYNSSGQISLGPGVMVAEMPMQKGIASSTVYTTGDYTIEAIAEFRIKAKVLSKKNYYLDREADLSPVDVALGWGKMSDERVLEHIDRSQSGRFYRWQVDEFPIPRREIETHSANMHLIPASDAVKRVIDKVRKGDIIEITGRWVNVMSNRDAWYWESSQTRNDRGKGACELIWVESADIRSL